MRMPIRAVERTAMKRDEPIHMLAKRSVVDVDPDWTLRRVAELLADDYIGAAVVRGVRPMGAEGSRADGIISERDIVRALAEGVDPDAERARNVMTTDLATAAPGESITTVAQRMLDDEIRHVPIEENGVVVGVVSERDMLRALIAD
jgi:CBS domain-containing protein